MKLQETYVCEAVESDPRWLPARKTVLTSTGVAACLGLAVNAKGQPWMTYDDLMEEYLGLREVEVTRNMLWGQREQDRALEDCRDIFALDVKPQSSFHISGNLGASLDGLLLRCDMNASGLPGLMSSQPMWETVRRQIDSCLAFYGPGLIELKCPTEWGGKSWRVDAGPAYYIAQLKQAMCVVEADWGLLFGKIGGHDARAYVVERDPLFDERARKVATKFLKDLEQRRAEQ